MFTLSLFYMVVYLIYREHNVCDINPIHHLFATGTIEVCEVEGLDYVW